jgi:biopolymer transport protein ExbB
MSKTKNSGSSLGETLRSAFATSVILIAFIVALAIYKFVMGNPLNFEGGNPDGHPLPGNYLAIIYKGGFIVPLLIMLLLVVVTFSIERFVTLHKIRGKSRINVFVKKLQGLLAENKLDQAIAECDKNQGSLANVMRAGLTRFKELESDTTLAKDQKITALQQVFEEATALELPMMSKNIVIFSSIASLSVLTGLMGTVFGMIRAFAALAQAGAPDALALANGISEALINTAFGIGGSLLAIVFYNVFQTKIDKMTFKIDEAGFSLVNTFAARQKN